ncbi:hypothetical protein UFOVP736_40 [uncultured Caudovirales phage]|uniref:Uncharacterized protein n=1 Tax=uncultured Caudovirales phage TaxID=2100421 RepID=A0A6J7X186_9CAUD|nr:hypothetical protein UFOVP705_41 [uncultured Caudovirales phage]CAB5224203.1 hypothetical protein UFOVP736_40 [uncultured Caudovirales phage]
MIPTIPITHFRPFTAQDCPVRESLHHPRIVGDRIVATNGKVIVHALISEIMLDPDYPITSHPKFPNYQSIFESVTNEHCVTLPPLPACPADVECSECRGSGIITCSKCEHDHDCKKCTGTGWIEGASHWDLSLGEERYNARLISHILALPHPTFYHCQVGLYFQFGQSGHGILSRLPKE